MAYRNPAFVARHLGAEVGVSGITSSTTAAGQGVERLIDYRLGANMKFNAAAANQFVQYDLGNDQTASRLIIPAGHNLSGASYELRADGANPPTTVRASGTFGLGLADISWSPEVVARRWRLVILTSGQWEFGEMWLGRRRQTSTGVVQGWEAPWSVPQVRREFPARSAVLIEGPARRRWGIEHRALAGTDLDIYDEVLVRDGLPFWFFPPDDVIVTPLLMLLDQGTGERTQDSPEPRSSEGPTYTAKLDMTEQLE